MVTLNTTPNRGYQEPAVGNTLEVDVGRLIAALRAIDVDVADALAQIVAKAGLASPAFTGTPTAPTAAPGTDSGQLATTAFVRAAIVALIDSSPGALDTLNELAAALGDDPNFSTTVLTAIGLKADAAATTAALDKRVRVDAAQAFTAAEKGQAIANIGGGDLAGLRNKVINPLFAVNQRGKSGTVTLTAGQYGHDRFKAGASGCTYTFSTTNGVTTLTISAGTIQQVIEDACFAGASGEYFLSWSGTALGRINSGSYGNSGEVSATCNGSANVTVEWGTGTLSLPQFELGFVTAFSGRHPQQELALCQRYYETVQNLVSAAHDISTSQHTTWVFKTTKRTVPTITADWNSVVPSVVAPSVVSVRFNSSSAFYQAAGQTARSDAEL